MKKLFTWVDVNQCLADFYNQLPADRLKGVCFRAYWDGLHIHASTNTSITPLIADLCEIFGNKFDAVAMAIKLEAGRLPIVITDEEYESDIFKEGFFPNFTSQSWIGERIPLSENDFVYEDNPVMIAVHTIIGESGIIAVDLARELEARGNKVLIIDSDFECPPVAGFTKNSEVSYSDLFTMAHGDSTPGFENTLSCVETIITTTEAGLYFLPAFREGEDIGRPRILPEHFCSWGEPFKLQDLVIALANRLKVDYVVVNLPSGFSEYAAPWLFDARVQKVHEIEDSEEYISGTLMLMERVKEKMELFSGSLAPLSTLLHNGNTLGFLKDERNIVNFSVTDVTQLADHFIYNF